MPADLVQRETRTWTNVSDPDPSWIKSWRSGSHTTFSSRSDELISLLADSFDFSVYRTESMYRVLFVEPADYGDRLTSDLPYDSGTVSETVAPTARPDALTEEFAGLSTSAMVDEVREWLNLTHEEVARIAGLSRSALFYWKTHDTEPRPGSRRRILRLHSLAELLVKRLGADGARLWLETGHPTPMQQLMVQDLDSVENNFRSVFFRQPDLIPGAERRIGAQVDIELNGDSTAPRRSKRVPKKAK
jgi:DNA-binding transcriptional regulator YiaG